MTDAFFDELNKVNVGKIPRQILAGIAIKLSNRILEEGRWMPSQFDGLEAIFKTIIKTDSNIEFIDEILGITLDLDQEFWWEPATSLVKCAEYLARSNIIYAIEELAICMNRMDGIDPYHVQGIARMREILQ